MDAAMSERDLRYEGPGSITRRWRVVCLFEPRAGLSRTRRARSRGAGTPNNWNQAPHRTEDELISEAAQIEPLALESGDDTARAQPTA